MTGDFCHSLMSSWVTGELSKDQSCSDCLLGTLKLDQSSPFTYNAAFAKQGMFRRLHLYNTMFSMLTARILHQQARSSACQKHARFTLSSRTILATMLQQSNVLISPSPSCRRGTRT